MDPMLGTDVFSCNEILDPNTSRWKNNVYTLPKTNSSPLKIGYPKKDTIVFQPSIFGCYVSFKEGIFCSSRCCIRSPWRTVQMHDKTVWIERKSLGCCHIVVELKRQILNSVLHVFREMSDIFRWWGPVKKDVHPLRVLGKGLLF